MRYAIENFDRSYFGPSCHRVVGLFEFGVMGDIDWDDVLPKADLSEEEGVVDLVPCVETAIVPHTLEAELAVAIPRPSVKPLPRTRASRWTKKLPAPLRRSENEKHLAAA